MKDNIEIFNYYADMYEVSDEDREKILDIIRPIIMHPEFVRRAKPEFFHHGEITLFEHTIADTIRTYLLSVKYIANNEGVDFDIKTALYIALFHDMYTVPWQNNKESKVNKLRHAHGFRHPIEAVVNAYNWFPYVFSFDNTEKIIDGILHHMYPFPVMTINECDDNKYELKNYGLYQQLPEDIIKAMIISTNRKTVFGFSFTKSKYIEGRIMSLADRKTSYGQIKGIYDLIALVTGRNRRLKK